MFPPVITPIISNCKILQLFTYSINIPVIPRFITHGFAPIITPDSFLPHLLHIFPSVIAPNTTTVITANGTHIYTYYYAPSVNGMYM